MKIPFNKPFLAGNEIRYIEEAVASGKISGNGKYTMLCQNFFEINYQIKKALLTTSCTDALEMAAILIDIQPGDEVIMPTYTFVSTANAFVLRGASIIFCDSRPDHPGMDEKQLENLITEKTKAIVPVHYAGVACDMELIMQLAKQYNLYVIEDAANAIESSFTFQNGVKKPLGSIGHLSTFSFHETKNVIAGEGGLLGINDESLIERAEIIWEKGTNRAAFMRGDVSKYHWVDIGSSFLPSEITAAFLWAQMEKIDVIQKKRKGLWEFYFEKIQKPGLIKPLIPDYASNNAHMFYLICESMERRDELIELFSKNNILAVFHYLCLHQSPYYANQYHGEPLQNAVKYSQQLIRLPLFYSMEKDEIEFIVDVANQH